MADSRVLVVPATGPPARGNSARAWAQLGRNRAALAGLLVIAVLVLAAIFAPFLTPYNPYLVSLEIRLQPPGGAHPLGTDELGRDILARLLFGARVSLWVGVVTVVLAGLIGVAGGLAAGYLGGYWDAIIMRLVDIFLAFPVIILAIAIVAVRGPGLTNVLIALALVYWTTYARVARAVVLTLREEEYTWAARTLGASTFRIMLRHLLPNAVAPLVVLASLGMGNAILAEAALSFLGLGIQPPEASWGSMLNFGMQFLREDSFLSTTPGLAIFVTVLGFNLLGDGLRDALDPRLRT
ncbi:MAG TPA: ABC transporter permease [Chloroflexota bacterium]|nr:ABC transporter permease [Chloroflexota bacterium]